jgi:hypothetical protein
MCAMGVASPAFVDVCAPAKGRFDLTSLLRFVHRTIHGAPSGRSVPARSAASLVSRQGTIYSAPYRYLFRQPIHMDFPFVGTVQPHSVIQSNHIVVAC